MKRIFFIRHAKSSWADLNLDDIDRPLNGRGRRDAPFMAEKLSMVIPSVDLAIVSPAKRARETAKYFKKEIDFANKITVEKVYHAWTDTLVEVVREIDPKVDTALIFGHNPGFTEFFNKYSLDRIDNLPTCGIFELKVEGKWSDISSKSTTTGDLLYPKMYQR